MNRRAFTLIELLIVITIIGLLVGISFSVGGEVIDGGKRTATEQTLRVLDTALSAYKSAKDDLPPVQCVYVAPTGGPREVWPMSDLRDMASTAGQRGGQPIVPGGNQMINSVGFFLYEALKVPQAKAAIDQLPTKFVSTFDIDGEGDNQPELVTVFDAWNNPIRFVHPALDGIMPGESETGNIDLAAQRLGPPPAGTTYAITQVRRNRSEEQQPPPVAAQDLGDGDGARCVGASGYFYSAGPDGKVGVSRDGSGKIVEDFNADNVYSKAPTFPINKN